jgi:hypothetical protein
MHSLHAFLINLEKEGNKRKVEALRNERKKRNLRYTGFGKKTQWRVGKESLCFVQKWSLDFHYLTCELHWIGQQGPVKIKGFRVDESS